MMSVAELRKALEDLRGDSEVLLDVKVSGDTIARIPVSGASHEGPDRLGFSFLHLEGDARIGDLAEAAELAGLLELPEREG